MSKKLLLIIPMSLALSGCLGDLIEWGCLFSEDEGHCYQAAAVQDSEPETCEKVTSDFESSNPPQDKCYLQIAENSGDPLVCDNIKGGPASYTPEECIAGVMRHGSPEECVDSEDENACRTMYATNGRRCGDNFYFDRQAVQCVSYDEEEAAAAAAQNDSTTSLSNAEQADIASLQDAATGKYMELLRQDAASATDPARKAGLEAYIGFLEQGGEALESAQSSFDDLQALQRIFIDTYDESMSIENYDVAADLDPGYWDQFNTRLFGEDPEPTGINKENAEAQTAMGVYETLLGVQSENDFLKQGKLERLGGEITSHFKDKWTGELVEGATDLAKNTAGLAFGAVTHVGDALEAFKSEAKKQTFIGLTRAYNRRRAAIEQSNPSLTPTEAHQQAVAQVKDDPYQDLKGLSPIRFENLLLNDCSSYNGELCIDPKVWWTALDKTYRYNHK